MESLTLLEAHVEHIHALHGCTADVTVKIVTLPEDQLQELEGEGGEEEVVGRDREGDLTNAMSMLLDSLLVSSKLKNTRYNVYLRAMCVCVCVCVCTEWCGRARVRGQTETVRTGFWI